MKPSVFLFVLYLVASLLLSFYSYTQVDLNLTLSRVSVWQTMQKSFQYIGYYQRPLSTAFYLGLLALYYVLYFGVLRFIKRGIIRDRQLWRIILGVTLLLVFSYPAFSYDIFNYMFTAKTVLVYHKNPYTVIPLQFSGIEPWLSFMHWTHLPSAYTPLWILTTLPPYLLGFGYFLLILWNIKLVVAGGYLAAAWFIGKILGKLDPKHTTLGVAAFSLNPLIIIESLVSAHNDITMMALALGAMYLYLVKRPLASLFILALSVSMKLMTLFLVPVFFLKWERKYALCAMLVGFILVVLEREVLPWYFVWIMPFIAILPRSADLIVLASGVSLGLLARYTPFLYFGHWNDPVPTIKFWVTIIPILVSAVGILMYRFVRKRGASFALKSRLRI